MNKTLKHARGDVALNLKHMLQGKKTIAALNKLHSYVTYYTDKKELT